MPTVPDALIEIRTLSPAETQALISAEITHKLTTRAHDCFLRFVNSTTVLWAGWYRGELRAVWGLMPPTLLSDTAYLWLHVVEPVDDCEFVFVRHSQRAIEEALRRFPTIIGHCVQSNHRARRWLRWLGASFDRPEGGAVRFAIHAKG